MQSCTCSREESYCIGRIEKDRVYAGKLEDRARKAIERFVQVS
jgi:hypothetical protein